MVVVAAFVDAVCTMVSELSACGIPATSNGDFVGADSSDWDSTVSRYARDTVSIIIYVGF